MNNKYLTAGLQTRSPATGMTLGVNTPSLAGTKLTYAMSGESLEKAREIPQPPEPYREMCLRVNGRMHGILYLSYAEARAAAGQMEAEGRRVEILDKTSVDKLNMAFAEAAFSLRRNNKSRVQNNTVAAET